MDDPYSTHRVDAEQLSGRCDPASFPFRTTEELRPLDGFLGQERAVRAIEFGLGMKGPGYHLYVAGPEGIGKATVVESFLRGRAAQLPAPPDWIYVHNFDEPDHPAAIALPAGQGREFANAVQRAVERATVELRQVFESESYVRQRQDVGQALDRQRGELLDEASRNATQMGFTLQFSPMGVASTPIIDGKPVSPEDFQKLPPDVQERLKGQSQQIERMVQDTLLKIRALERSAQQEIETLDRQVATFAIEHLFQALVERYGQDPEVAQFLAAARDDMANERDKLLKGEEGTEARPGGMPLQPGSPLRRYQVNVFVSNDPQDGAPVITERNPTYYNVLGRIEYVGIFGAMVTDHLQIRPGSLARANGGYLVLRLRDLLVNGLTYEGLKRALRTRELPVENLAETLGLVPTTGLRPEPIPLNVKVIIVGEADLYPLLYRLDPDFRELFQTKAEFAVDLERTEQNVMGLASFVRGQCERTGVGHFSSEAMARLVEYSSRVVEDQRRLSANMGEFVELLRQADYWAKQSAVTVVRREDIDRALEERVYRSSLVRDRVQQMIAEHTILIDTAGEKVGQVNALSVVDLGDLLFGQPSRVTCVTAAGRGTIVNVERETGMAGRIHNKGFFILRGYLAHRFGQARAMAVHASLTFEQLYGQIEGDSASDAELYALLSSLSGVPIKQTIAVTGSMNQLGEIQPIGGATHKIEGFFEVCRARGLDGSHGVLVPRSNVPNIVLRPEVVQAIAEGRFHVWAVDRVEEGIEVLTGVPAGERDAQGHYPQGSVFQRVEERLDAFARALGEGPAGAPPEAPHIWLPAQPPSPPGLPPEPPPQPPVRA